MKLATKASGDELTLSSVTVSTPSSNVMDSPENSPAITTLVPSTAALQPSGKPFSVVPAVAHAIVPSAANVARKTPNVNCGAVNVIGPPEAANETKSENRPTTDARPAPSTATSRASAKVLSPARAQAKFPLPLYMATNAPGSPAAGSVTAPGPVPNTVGPVNDPEITTFPASLTPTPSPRSWPRPPASRAHARSPAGP